MCFKFSNILNFRRLRIRSTLISFLRDSIVA